MISVPEGLDWLHQSSDGRRWLAELPELIDRAAGRWDLKVGDPFPDSYVSVVLPAERADGSAAVLKMQFPHHESTHEAAALAHWDGDGVVKLLASDTRDHALLLERCKPGTHLSDADPALALEVLVELLPRLWKPAGSPFQTLADEAQMWTRNLPSNWETAGHPCERELIDAALEAIETLSATQGDQVLLHQDLHGGNVLAAQREPWLVIDPKPLVGEREFSLAPIVRAFEFGPGIDRALHRLDHLTEQLRLDRERTRQWAFVQTLAWSFGSDYLTQHVETARALHRA